MQILPRYATLVVVLSTLLAVTCGRSDIAPTAPSAVGLPAAFRAQAPASTGVLRDFEIRPREFRGGDWTTGTVFLNDPAPPGGLVVTVTASKHEARIPESFTIEAGASSGAFAFSTADVSADMEVLVTIATGAESRSVQIRLLPPTATVPPPAPAPSPSPSPAPGPTGTVTLSALIN